MIRPARSARRRLHVERLESRSLLSVDLPSVWPVPEPGPSNSILVRFAAGTPAARQDAALAPFRGRVSASYPDGPELVTLGEGIAPSAAIAGLGADPEVVYAVPDARVHAESAPVLPNDPGFGAQWGLNNANNVDINAPEAWGVTTGNRSTIVAVIDTGIDLVNPDFAGRIWTNPTNGAAAGYPNDIHGWNFISHNNYVQDDNGHGTHVSAIIGAAGNNGSGVSGIAWNVQIMPLKFLDSHGDGTTDDAVAAIYYAVNHGARVINASWGGDEANTAPLQDSIAYANAHNVVFVSAAGNRGVDNNSYPSYPANYRYPNQLSVAAVDRNGNLPSYSNYGSRTVDLAAPGDNIVSDVPAYINAYGVETLSGTSMATAYVSGVAALVSGLNPGFGAAQVVQRIDATTKPLPSLAGRTITGGMVDAYAAVSAAAPVAIASAGAPAAGIPALAPGASTDVQVRASLLASDEYLAAHGGTAPGFIAGLYNSLLGHAPDGYGLQQWLGVSNAGTSTRYQIATAIMTSPEGRLTEVARWFRRDLGRTDPIGALKVNPGVAAWAHLLDVGFGDATVRAAILAQPEFLIAHGASPPPVVRGLYGVLLGRDADPTGLAGWGGLLWSGAAPFDVIRSLQGTPEARQTQVARWFVDDLGRPDDVGQLKADPGVRAWAAALGNS